jgi:hypothetical protein
MLTHEQVWQAIAIAGVAVITIGLILLTMLHLNIPSDKSKPDHPRHTADS